MGDDGAAEGALFFGGLLGGGYVIAEAFVELLVELVEQADEHEHHDRDEHEGDDAAREDAVIERDRAGGMTMSSTKDLAMLVNAAPTVKPTANLIILPRNANVLNSSSTFMARPPC